ncbi:MAG: iron uptake porin [Spirulinaceae cyanobacterium RM2_2_10]|nr:iron uptake porin [Spirulinaceae cyanobacterium RM2_2_10]
MGQVLGVEQLRDVSPTDWAFQALSDLIARYDCLVGYPDGTFRGNRALSRYEFAAGLNACMQQIERLLAEATADLATRDDLETLERLMREFETELALLGTRVDSLEARTTLLEDSQFSTTTKLFGQSIFGVQGRTGGSFTSAGVTRPDTANEITFIHNTQLSLFTQFSPRTLLLTSMQAGNGETTDNTTRELAPYVGLAYEGNTNNQLQLTDLNLRHLVSDNFAVIVGPRGISPVNVFRGSNRVESAGSGPLSRFAQRNPIISVGAGDAGFGFDWQVIPSLSVQGVYASRLGADATNGGLFGGDSNNTTVGVQVVGSPLDSLDLTLQYINSYSPFGFLGTGIGDDRVVIGNTNPVFNLRAPIKTNALGFGFEWRPLDKLSWGGWMGYTSSDYLVGTGTVETFNWMTYLNFPDLGGEGNLGGIYFGQPPRISTSNLPSADLLAGRQARNVPSFFSQADLLVAAPGGQPSETYHAEVFYRIKVTDNISVTPGIIAIFNPLQNSANDTIVIGAIRTTFTF